MQIQIWLTDELEVQTAKCECPRGLEICHHIAATLLASHYELSKTDGDCSWAPKPTDSSQVKTIDEIFNIAKPPKVTNRNLNENEIQELFEKLQGVPPVGFLWLLRSYFDDDNNDDSNNNNEILDSIDVQHFILSHEFDTADDKTFYLQRKMELNSAQINNIMNITNGQADNVDWFVVRKNRITASNFGKVINSVHRNRFPPSLFSTLFGEQNTLIRKKPLFHFKNVSY